MGYYLNPPTKAIEVGRRLEGNNYADLVSQLGSGEVLVGLYDRIIFMNAPQLFSENEFNEFQRQPILHIGFFAVHESDFPDSTLQQGRVEKSVLDK